MRVRARNGQHLRRDRLGQAVRELRAVREQHLADTCDLRRRLRGVGRVVPDHQHVHVATGLGRRGHRVQRRALEGLVVVFRQYECSHGVSQMALASFFSLLTSVATSGTLMPALRDGGSETFSVFSRGVTSTPRSAGFSVSSGFFFAFMMFGSVT